MQEVALRVSFPSLFALTVDKDASVTDVWEVSGEVGGWFPCFTRPLNDWEMDAIESFFQTPQGKRVCLGKEDMLLLKESKDENFFVKSLSEVLNRPSTLSFSFRNIWSFRVPTKVDFFA